ncbi:acyltransferase family protein [Flavobacterium sp. W22_SRS_FK3]|uniref:acyltransferase family protein n=1 Tax=Flavobacterium sp. W22_SRS_FK3 TaxID=3240275 RepID=UPI003F918951
MVRERLISLDVFRGLTILLMTVVNNPGDWGNVYSPLLHADWHGCTPTDLVFPFFIFIMGVAVPLAMPQKLYDSTTFNKILVRSLRMLCLGIFFNFFGKIQLFGLEGIPLLIGRLAITIVVGYALMGSFSPKVKNILALSILFSYLFLAYSGIQAYHDVRLPGVLQRIAVVYFVVSLLYLKTPQKTQIVTGVVLLLGYWGLMTLIPVPGIGAPNLEKGTNLASWLDSILLKGHMYSATKTWDPEGILSTIPSIVNGIIGLLVGQILLREIAKNQKAMKMTIIGVALIVAGLFLNIIFPINKSLWTSSYVLYTTGLATTFLSILYYVIDIADYKKGFKPFLIWGINPMIVFFTSQIIPQALVMIQFKNPHNTEQQINLLDYLYSFGIAPFFNNPKAASLAGALVYVAIWTFILWIFYKNKLIFKV